MRRTKNILIIIFLLLINSCEEKSPLLSENSILFSGKIIDSETENPINSASIKFNEYETLTDSNGYFNIINISMGEYVLSVIHPNYNDYNQQIKISTDTTVSIKIMIKYSDYFPLSIGQKKYSYEYNYTHGSPRPSYTKTKGISIWNLLEILPNNDSTEYKILETRIDTVEQYISFGGTFTHIDTLNNYFSIFESPDHQISSSKFPNKVTVKRYDRIDNSESVYYSSGEGYIDIVRDIGINKLLKASPDGGATWISTYTLLE